MRPLDEVLSRRNSKSCAPATAEKKRELLESMPPEKIEDMLVAMPQPQRQQLFGPASSAVRREILLLNGPQQVVAYDLLDSKMLRAIESNRQLAEELDDFWFNHFNVFYEKGADRFLIPEYEREAIRPHVLGKFRDLLEATAKSPAMLFYLDNFESVRPDLDANDKKRKVKRGLNENYGRELMELHTLGVNGGYTQKDVTEVARCFTGWTIHEPRKGGGFFYNDKLHDKGEKIVLGHVIPAGGGMEDGEKVLDILARHPSTAHFISKELAQRFVADNPPEALVDRMAQTFLATNGDIREVMKTMLDSKEFWSRGRVSRQDEIAVRDGGQFGARVGRQCHRRLGAGESGGQAGRAAVSQAGAHRLFELEFGMGELGGAAGAHEFRAAAGAKPRGGRESGCVALRRRSERRWPRR